MKSKDLVKLIMQADPTGECEICVDNVDIVDIDGPMPSYWDGQFVQIICNEEKRTTDNGNGIDKVVARTKGSKIKLRLMHPEDAFLDNPDAEFEMDPYNRERHEAWTNTVEKWRQQGRELQKEIKADVEKIRTDIKTTQSGSSKCPAEEEMYKVVSDIKKNSPNRPKKNLNYGPISSKK